MIAKKVWLVLDQLGEIKRGQVGFNHATRAKAYEEAKLHNNLTPANAPHVVRRAYVIETFVPLKNGYTMKTYQYELILK